MRALPSGSSISELSPKAGAHCTKAFKGQGLQTTNFVESLPYHDLGGPGLERLCFSLVLAQGYVAPRFFGKSGQTDYGVDLLASRGGLISVWQCKNLAHEPTAGRVEAWLSEFETTWLRERDLPKPERYLLCCPQPLRSLQVSEQWIRITQEFRARTGIDVDLWHKDLLDELLRTRPDIVADNFSDRHAEHFCGVNDWRPDLFWPSSVDLSHPRELERYFERQGEGRLYVDEAEIENIERVFDSGTLTLLRGSPGTGKTLAALAFTKVLEEKGWRTYYVNLRNASVSESELAAGIRRRLAQPTVFVLDDCHSHFDLVDALMRRLATERNHPNLKLLCVARWTPTHEPRSDYHPFVDEELKQHDRILTFENTPERRRQVIRALRPGLTLTESFCDKLGELCADDLYLIDDVLDQFADDIDLELVAREDLYRALRVRYFGAPVVALPKIRQLAAAAQFDLSPSPSLFDAQLSLEERRLLPRIAVLAGTPPGYHFVHTAAAEATFHAICFGDGIVDEEAIAERAALDLIRLLSAEAALCETVLQHESWSEHLLTVLQNHLRQLGERSQLDIKCRILGAAPIKAMLFGSAAERGDVKTIAGALLVLSTSKHPAASEFKELLSTTLETHAAGPLSRGSLILTIRAIDALRGIDQVAGDRVVKRIGVQRWTKLVESVGSLTELFSLCRVVDSEFGKELVHTLDGGSLKVILDRTINTDRRVLALSRVLRGMKFHVGVESVQRDLEERIGPASWLALVEANGSLFELFHLLGSVTSVTAKHLLTAIDGDYIDSIIAVTIGRQRSIGALNHALRESKRNGEVRPLVEKLEQLIGSRRWLTLIRSNGTIADLFRMLRELAPGFAEELIAAIDDGYLNAIIGKTIDLRTSIGTLHLTLYHLGRDESTRSVLRQLEDRITVGRWLTLVEANGTLYELFKLLSFSTPAFAKGLLDSLEDNDLTTLIRRTIERDRSIGTLHLALYELRKEKSNESLLIQLEHRIGAGRWLSLIAENGTLFELFALLRHCTFEFASILIDALDDDYVASLVRRTIEQERSIGTLHFGLEELGKVKNAKPLLATLERRIGAQQWLTLIRANGALPELFKLLTHSTPAFKLELITLIDEDYIDAVTNRTLKEQRLVAAMAFTIRELRSHAETREGLTSLARRIGARRWLALIALSGSLVLLFRLLQHSDPLFAKELLDAIDEGYMEALCSSVILKGQPIGTLAFTLQAWGKTKETQPLITALERRIGVRRWLNLIQRNGTLFDLFVLLQRATPVFVEVLVETLDDAYLDELIDKTVALGRSIGTLNFAMRRLSRDKRTRPLAWAFEAKFGTRRWLKLIEKNGTIVELFNMVQHSTLEFAAKIVDELDDHYLQQIVTKTIEGSRSIGTLYFTFRNLQRSAPALHEALERKLRPLVFWRLMEGVGTLGSVAELATHMSKGYREEIRLAAAEVGLVGWGDICRRGERGLWNIAKLLHDHPDLLFAEAAGKRLKAAIADNVAEITSASGWHSINASLKLLSDGPPAEIWNIVMAAAADRIGAAGVADLKGLDFRDAVNALECLWSKRDDLRNQLSTKLQTILPPPRSWLNDPEAYYEDARILFGLIESREVPDGDVKWVFDVALQPAQFRSLGKADPLILFYHLWSLLALGMDRLSLTPAEFHSRIPLTSLMRLAEWFDGKIDGHVSMDTAHELLAMLGFMSFIGLDCRKRAQSLAKHRQVKAFNPSLVVLKYDFVQAFFICLGGEGLNSDNSCFTPQVCRYLLERARKYENAGPAVGWLMQDLGSRKARRVRLH